MAVYHTNLENFIETLTLAAREDKNKRLKNKFLDAWYELYPKDYDLQYNKAFGKEQQMILWLLKGQGRKSVQTKIVAIMDAINRKYVSQADANRG